MEGQKLKGS